MAVELVFPANAPFPHSCISCGTVSQKMFLFSSSQDYYGRPMICVSCAYFMYSNWGESLGWFEQWHQRIRTLEVEKNIALSGQTSLAEALSEMKAGFDGIVSTFHARLDAIASGSNVLDSIFGAEAIESERQAAELRSDEGTAGISGGS